MNVLVAVASKHGGTRRIAEAIAGELRTPGIGVDLRDIGSVDELSRYDAVVLGSAVYMGHWMREAERFVEAHRAALAAIPVWLFSSGPLGADDPKPPGDPEGIDRLVADTRARGHRTFAGRLEPADLGFGERLVAKAVHAPTGDFRDWDTIRGWAREIGAALRPVTVHGGATGDPAVSMPKGEMP